MKKKTYFSVFFMGLISLACTRFPQNEEQENVNTTENEPDRVEDVTELTYRDVVAMVFDDDGERIEWHGEEMPNELTDLLSISEGDPCGEGDCGKILMLTSSAEKAITLVIRGDYDLKGDQGYIPRKYTIDAGQTLSIGCSHLCLNGESFEFSRTIVGSDFVE